MKRMLYFTAEWCGPCNMFGPIIAKLALEYPIQKIDIDQNPIITKQYGVKSVPTTILINGDTGAEIQRNVGVQTPASIIKQFS